MGLHVSDVMTAQVKTVGPEMKLVDLEAFFTNQRVSGAPVVSEQRLIGVVSRSDVVRLVIEEEAEVRSALSFYFYLSPWGDEVSLLNLISRESTKVLAHRLETLRVRDAMTPRIIAVGPDTSIKKACKTMAAHGVHRLLVIEDDILQGLVSSLDIVRAVAERGLSS